MPQLKKLSSAQKKRLQQHKKHHSEKHMKIVYAYVNDARNIICQGA